MSVWKKLKLSVLVDQTQTSLISKKNSTLFHHRETTRIKDCKWSEKHSVKQMKRRIMFAGGPACILSFSRLSSRIWNLEQHLPERAMVWLKHTSEIKKKWRLFCCTPRVLTKCWSRDATSQGERSGLGKSVKLTDYIRNLASSIETQDKSKRQSGKFPIHSFIKSLLKPLIWKITEGWKKSFLLWTSIKHDLFNERCSLMDPGYEIRNESN